MPFPIMPPAGQAIAFTYLQEVASDLAPATKYRTNAYPQVVLTQNGMTRDPDAPVIFEARVLVEVYGGTDEVATEDHARRAYAMFSALSSRDVSEWWVQRVDEVTGLASYPDVARQLPRWTFTVGIRARGTQV